MGEVIALLSGKGGTGKTTLCAGIATALANLGSSVLCIDCDIGLRNLDISLGLAHTDSLSFVDVCCGEYTLDQALRHSVYPNLAFLTAPVNATAETIDRADFSAMLRAAREQFDYVFLDAPAGVELGFQLCASYADQIFLVTCPEPAAVRDAARAAEKLELMGKDSIRLLVNRINKKLFHITNVTVDDVMDEAGLPLLGIVPEDTNIPLAAAFEQPLLRYTKRGAAAACKRIAKRIQGKPVPLSIR